MNLFDRMRSDNASWYTAHPLFSLSDAELTKLAAQAKMTVAELMQHAITPSIRMTCPLCGLPQTHLSLCKGCGGGSFGYDLEMAYPPDADGVTIIDHLRTALAAALDGIASEEQLTAALTRAFQYGGCNICADCWRMTSTNWTAYTTCPIFLLYETATHTPHTAAIGPIMDGNFHPDTWRAQVRAHWAGAALRPEITAWRNAILTTAMADVDEQVQVIRQMVRQMVNGEDQP